MDDKNDAPTGEYPKYKKYPLSEEKQIETAQALQRLGSCVAVSHSPEHNTLRLCLKDRSEVLVYVDESGALSLKVMQGNVPEMISDLQRRVEELERKLDSK